MRLRHLAAALLGLCLALGAPVARAGGPITSGTTVAGTIAGPTYLETWTFSGTSGQLVLIGAVTSSGALNTAIVLKAPGGAVVVNTTTDRVEHQLTATGTWTIQIEDSGLNDAGTYNIGFMNITAGPLTNAGDLNGGPITSSDVVTGTTGVTDFDAYTFSGTNGQRILVSGVATGGSGYNTNIYLYPPGGGTQSASTYTGDLLDFQLTSTGTWTIVIEDNSNDTSGTFTLSFLNVTAGPYTNGGDPDGGAIVSNEVKSGSFQTVGDMDAWTFTGSANQLALLAGIITGAGTHNTQLALYPPNGGAAVLNTTADRNEQTTATAGTWTIVIYDSGLNDTGAYSLGYLNVTAGPFTNAGDLNGGPITSNEPRAGVTGGPGDFDAYVFTGAQNDRIVVTAPATAGAGYNTNIVLYPPNGGPQAASSYSGDRLDFQLTSAGNWTIVIEDSGVDTPGNYNVCFLNVTSGPMNTNGDVGAIDPSASVTAAMDQVGDIDGYIFYGASGETANITATTLTGAMNTQIVVYPPGGGAALQNTSSDNVVQLLPTSGFYRIVIEDNGNDQVGTYRLTLTGTQSGLPETPFELPDGRRALLLPAAPSPFRRVTLLAFHLRNPSPVLLRVFNAEGALVRTLVDGTLEPGRHEASWDGRDERGISSGSGVYYLQLLADGENVRQKVVHIR